MGVSKTSKRQKRGLSDSARRRIRTPLLLGKGVGPDRERRATPLPPTLSSAHDCVEVTLQRLTLSTGLLHCTWGQTSSARAAHLLSRTGTKNNDHPRGRMSENTQRDLFGAARSVKTTCMYFPLLFQATALLME